ncbi:MAG: hypothetical protein K9L86_03380 [Candidatus Omnitrophica bacterium]|nr:hypothetical protein [Candidatus Omnitrophota bacterium]
MKTLFFFIAFLLIFPANSSFALFKPVENLEDTQIKRLVISPFDSTSVYTTSKNSLYQSQDSGKSFEKVSVFKDEEVQHLFFDPYFANIVYIVTSRHLYRWEEKLEVLFSAPDEEFIYSAARHKEKIYVGTNKGLYFSFEDALIWHKPKNSIEATVYYIEPANEQVYLATDRGVYSLSGDDRFKRLFVVRRQEEEDAEEFVPRIIKVDIFDKNRLWLGTSRGLYSSLNSGKNWSKVYIGGLGSLFINCIAQTKLQNDVLYLGSTRGFFKVNFKRKSSKQIFEGLHSSYIWWVTFTQQGIIYLSTSKGLFQETYFTPTANNNFRELAAKEPSIYEVQQKVLQYNEVHPDKIAKWRKRLKFRALLPDLNLDYDKTVTYDSGSDKYYIGPRDWGVSLSWNLADFVWNSYEDDIDTRSRLNTQLRLDIIDEINRVYYERLRLKNEIAISSLTKEELFSKKLRLEELTAIIDGYSGGYFSKRIKKLNEQQQ